MYGIRLVGMIFSGILIGNLLFRKYGLSIQYFLKYFESVYFKNLVLGFFIFIFFPQSRSFWLFLSRFGIQFNGDPHIGRFISTYFDPNYFGAICCIPFLISFQLYKHFPEEKGRWKIFLFFIGTLLTWSRSGIATLFCLFLWMGLPRFIRLLSSQKFSVSSRGIMFFCCLSGGVFGLLFLYSDSVLYFFDRFIHMKSDPSALGRLHSFNWGLNLIFQHPILGIGYNYLSIYLYDPVFGHTSVDSSLILTFITFGIPATFILLILFLCFCVSLFFKAKRMEAEFCSFFRILIFYSVVCVFFTSNFNNLIYYPFWLSPIIVIFSYLLNCLKETESFKKRIIFSGAC
jgi:hypothetical protein